MNALINTNITMLIALISLFLVLLFLTILHCYAKWFLDRNTQSSPSILVVPTVVLGARGLHNLHSLLTINRTNGHDESPPMKGLNSCAISSIPQFVFGESSTSDEECVICLGLFENGQKCKRLAFCEHVFHVECIDMWLHSNTTCPVCRALAIRLDVDVVVEVPKAS